MTAPAEPNATHLDLRERGAPRDGAPQFMDRRLTVQLAAFDHAEPDGEDRLIQELGASLKRTKVASVIYRDLNHSRGLAVLCLTEDPAELVERVRPCLAAAPIVPRTELSMLGRTYSSGYETDLEYWLLTRPRETVMNPAWPWAIWYPLRRSGAFERLEPREKAALLREHGEIGKAYGASDLAHDVRLASHGLDENNNDFTIGLVGKDLYPLSHVIQSMRGTRQTADFISQMGPFFVGRAVWRSG